jgi:hypothetical protein
MNRSNFEELRRRVIDTFYDEDLGIASGLRAQSAGVNKLPANRLSIGARRRKKNDYQVVFRVQARGGKAMQRARAEIERLPPSEAPELGVIQDLSVPSQKELAARAKGKPASMKQVRPPQIGYSVSHQDGSPGTIACFLDVKGGIGVLSCNHVLARSNAANADDLIYQPAKGDASPTVTEHRIGKLANYIELQRSGRNVFDAAYALLSEKIGTPINTIPDGFGAPDAGRHVKGVVDALDIPVGARLAKVGRTTGYTSVSAEGVAVGLNDVSIHFPSLGNLRFDEMIEIPWPSLKKPFSAGGDSGSLCYVEKK